jgi:hypothetical protein
MTVASNKHARQPAGFPNAISPEQLEMINHFYDEGGHAVSFYFKASPQQCKGNLDLLAMNDRVRQLISRDFQHGHVNTGFVRDLNHCLEVAEQNLELVSPLKVVFACHKQGIWLEYDLAISGHIVRMEAGTHFNVAPLMRLADITPQNLGVPPDLPLLR